MAKSAQLKTKETEASVDAFLQTIPDVKRADCQVILGMMKEATQQEPKMWGAAMIGFGNRRYKSERSGREVDWFTIGFSPRKANISIYVTLNMQAHASRLGRLGKHKTGVGCLYINRLGDVDIAVLKELIEAGANK